MAEKLIIIAIAGLEGEQREWQVRILPGVRTRDIMEKLGLSRMTLFRADRSEFRFDEEVYPAVADGQILFCAPRSILC